MATLNLDKMFVLIVNDYGPHGIAFAETGLADATFEKACEDLHSGQFSNPRAVIEFNPVEGRCRDITEEVMEVVREMNEAGGADNSPEEWESDELGTGRELEPSARAPW
jgi:hypothetical protein